MLRAMPKAKSKRKPVKASSKRSAPKAKPKPRTAKASKPKSGARKSGAIDPRVLAAIGLALEDERAASDRADALAQPLSAWAVSGRARPVRTR
jgi:hypothetical protein